MILACGGWKPLIATTKEANAQARQMFERAIALDPQYAEAYAYLGRYLLYRMELALESGPPDPGAGVSDGTTCDRVR